VLGEIAEDKLIKPGALLVGTVTRDGSARISEVEPLVMDGELWLSMMRTSLKTHDLQRDPRILLHSLINGPEAAPEVKVRGSVVEETDRDVQERYESSRRRASTPAESSPPAAPDPGCDNPGCATTLV
jgi:hypothetical protein